MIARGLRTFGGIRTESSDWPIVVTTFPEERVGDEDLRGMLGHLEELMRDAESRRERIFLITDITQMRQLTPASQRKLTADWMKHTFSLGKVASVGAAHVTPSAILRGIITAVAWVQPPPNPSHCVATLEEALSRGIAALSAAGQYVPPYLLERAKTRKAV
jgi:hypothetical protein